MITGLARLKYSSAHSSKCSYIGRLWIIATVLAAACADDAKERAGPACDLVGDSDQDCQIYDSDAQFSEGGGEPGAGSCVIVADDRPRTVFQCKGSLAATISFNTIKGNCGKTLGKAAHCNESHGFGLGIEPYETPAVMACCDAVGTPEADIARHCVADMVEQICLSIPRRIQALLDDGLITVGKNQARALRDWLEAHPQDCYDAFNVQGELPGTLAPGSWLVNGGNNKDWRMLKDFTVTINAAAVTTATLPEHEDEHIACFDNDYNNTEVFEDIVVIGPGLDGITPPDPAGD